MTFELNSFLQDIPKYLHLTASLLNQEQLTYEAQEIDKVRSLYEKNYQKPSRINLTSDELKLIFCIYCGQAFINHNGGKWEINKLKKDPAFGLPTIIEHGDPHCVWIRVNLFGWMLLIETNKFRGKLSDTIIRNISGESKLK